MNKVINIQLAGQVFWFDEDAYEILQTYLKRIKEQLSGNEDADEIIQDIELRLAELLFENITDTKQNITIENIEKIIEQVGFLENDQDESSESIEGANPKTLLNDDAAILGAVCVDLSRKTKIPIFIFRLLFLGLTFAGGFGFVLYVILWFSLKPKKKRDELFSNIKNSKAAKSINAEKSKVYVQKYIFFPLTLLGIGIKKVVLTLKNKGSIISKVLKFIFTIPFAIFVIGVLIAGSAGLYVISQYSFLPVIYQNLFSLALTFILVSFAWFWLNKLFPSKKRTLFSNDLKHILVVSIAYVLSCGFYFAYSVNDYSSDTTRSNFKQKFKTLSVEFEEAEMDKDLFNVKYTIIPSNKLDSTIRIDTEFMAAGKNYENVHQNINSISYAYTLQDSILILPSHFSLNKESVYRAQKVNVTIRIPDGLVVKSNHDIVRQYWYRDNYYRIFKDRYSSNEKKYFSQNNHFFELTEKNKKRLTRNERDGLMNIISKIVLHGESYSYILESPNYDDSFNDYLKNRYKDSSRDFYDIRKFFELDKSIKLSELRKLHSKILLLSEEHPDLESIIEYMDALIIVKSRD